MNINSKHTFYDLPDDYFLTSKQKIMNRLLWEDEMRIYPILSQKLEHGMLIPENYPAQLDVLSELIPYELLHQQKKEKRNVFSLPKAYFEKNQITINKSVSDNLDLKMPILPPAVNPYVVTHDYFEKSKQSLIAKLPVRKQPKIYILFKTTITYSAAAMLIVAIGIWLFKLNQPVTSNQLEDCNTLACIEKKELLKYKLQHLETDELYELIDADELEIKLNTKPEKDSHVSANDSLINELNDF